MTVKEMKEVLEGQNDETEIVIWSEYPLQGCDSIDSKVEYVHGNTEYSPRIELIRKRK